MNVGVSLSEPDTLCFTVSGELDNCSFIMQLVKKDGKALHVDYISPPVRVWMRENPPGRGWQGLTSWSCLTSSAGVAYNMICWWHFLEVVVPFVFISGYADLWTQRNANERTFFSALKMRKRFHKDPENGKKVSSSVGPDLSKMRRKGANATAAWFPPHTHTQNDTKGGKTVEVDKTQHQWRRSGQVLSRS